MFNYGDHDFFGDRNYLSFVSHTSWHFQILEAEETYRKRRTPAFIKSTKAVPCQRQETFTYTNI